MAATFDEAISARPRLEEQHEQTVRAEIENFRAKSLSFLAGEISENDFRPFRLKHGVYGQRQMGVQMVRCKVPGGLMSARQADNALMSARQPGNTSSRL